MKKLISLLLYTFLLLGLIACQKEQETSTLADTFLEANTGNWRSNGSNDTEACSSGAQCIGGLFTRFYAEETFLHFTPTAWYFSFPEDNRCRERGDQSHLEIVENTPTRLEYYYAREGEDGFLEEKTYLVRSGSQITFTFEDYLNGEMDYRSIARYEKSDIDNPCN